MKARDTQTNLLIDCISAILLEIDSTYNKYCKEIEIRSTNRIIIGKDDTTMIYTSFKW